MHGFQSSTAENVFKTISNLVKKILELSLLTSKINSVQKLSFSKIITLKKASKKIAKIVDAFAFGDDFWIKSSEVMFFEASNK